MTPWVPVVTSLESDPRLRVVSRAARGVLLHLLLRADALGAIPYVNHHDGPGTIGVIAWAERDGDPGLAVASEVQQLVAVGLLRLDDAARVLTLRVETPRFSEPVAQVQEAGEGEEGAALRAAVNRLAALWSKRKLKTQEERLTWLASPSGQEALARLGLTQEQGASLTSRAGRRGGRFGLDRPAHGDNGLSSHGHNHGDNVVTETVTTTVTTDSLSPAPPLSENTKRNNTDTHAPERARAVTTHGDNQPATTATTHGANSPLCGTEERVGLHPAEVVSTLRARCPSGVLLLGTDSRVLRDLGVVVRELAAREHEPVGLPAYRTLAEWYAAGGLAWRRAPLALRDLCAPGVLSEHVEQALAWDRRGRPRIAPPSTATPARGQRQRPAAPATAEDFARDALEPDPLIAIARGDL